MAKLETRVTRLLKAQGIPYRLLPHDEPVYTAEAAARQRGVKREEMVKSILLRDKDRHYVMACVTGEARLDTKAVRRCLPAGWKRLNFATAEEIAEITGYEMGAVAPLGLAADLPVIFDEAISWRVQVNISSGDPLAGVELDPADLIRLARAKLAPIARL